MLNRALCTHGQCVPQLRCNPGIRRAPVTQQHYQPGSWAALTTGAPWTLPGFLGPTYASNSRPGACGVALPGSEAATTPWLLAASLAEDLLWSLQLPSWQLRACLASMQGSLLSPASSIDMGAEPLSPNTLTFLQNLRTAQPAVAEVRDPADM